MHVPSRGEQLRIDVGRVERRNRAGEREDGAIARAAEDDSHPGSQARIDHDPAYVDAAFAQRVAHEFPEHVIPHHPDEGGAKSQAGSSGRKDAAGPADH